MEEKALELYKFMQERYLWQFYSRSWDRDENINGILNNLLAILAEEEVAVSNSLRNQALYAEAKMVALETRKKFPWLEELDKSQIQAIIESVRKKIIDITIARSQNVELNVPNY
ncbi:MAG TPA: Fe-only/vanadium nitrogenase subunit delta [Desulfitobacteriaceae bacterium]|nr:Fe-only/vanadium nitrogenase subunit delta [Desulfitobacteriaceae bacterium]